MHFIFVFLCVCSRCDATDSNQFRNFYLMAEWTVMSTKTTTMTKSLETRRNKYILCAMESEDATRVGDVAPTEIHFVYTSEKVCRNKKKGKKKSKYEDETEKKICAKCSAWMDAVCVCMRQKCWKCRGHCVSRRASPTGFIVPGISDLVATRKYVQQNGHRWLCGVNLAWPVYRMPLLLL